MCSASEPIAVSHQGTHEDGGYLFNSVVPVKFTENSKIAKRSGKLRVQSTNPIKQWVQCIITQVTRQICKNKDTPKIYQLKYM